MWILHWFYIPSHRKCEHDSCFIDLATENVDITSVFEQKVEAMAVMGAQSYLKGYYTELASRRGNHARRISGNQDVKYAEALQRMVPTVISEL